MVCKLYDMDVASTESRLFLGNLFMLGALYLFVLGTLDECDEFMILLHMLQIVQPSICDQSIDTFSYNIYLTKI